MALTLFSRCLLAAAIAVGFSASAQAAGDAVAGKIKTYACQGCHGIPGTKTAFPELYSVPKLGGQHAPYIVSALKAYKAGQRNHSTMQANASTLSDQDMEDIAAYYAAK
jgi:cytochrome c553